MSAAKRLKKAVGCHDLASAGPVAVASALIAEFIGTMFIILLGCGAALNFATGTDLVQIRFGTQRR